MAADENSWRTPAFRQSVVQKIDEAIRSSGMPTSKNSVEMEKHVFQKAKTREEYLGFVARLILHVREMNSKKASGMNPGGGAGQNMQDPINALQTLARQGTGNQLMGLVPPQSQPQVTATNLLQTLNQRPILQQKLQPGSVPMGPMSGQMAGPMGQMNNPMGGPMGGPMAGPMVSQMGGPLGGPMGGQMSAQMGGPMGAMGGPLGGPMPNQMGGPMGSPIPGQMGPMGGQMAHMQQRKVPGNEGGMMLGGQGPGYVGPRSVAPNTFLRQSPTPPHSAQSPASAAVISGNQMVASPALVPSPNAQMTPSMGGSMRSVGEDYKLEWYGENSPFNLVQDRHFPNAQDMEIDTEEIVNALRNQVLD